MKPAHHAVVKLLETVWDPAVLLLCTYTAQESKELTGSSEIWWKPPPDKARARCSVLL